MRANGGIIMPDDHARDLESAAHAAAAEAGAIKHCPAHKDIFINQGDPDATRHAYALATVRWKAEGKERSALHIKSLWRP
jgi:hypothetical protein